MAMSTSLQQQALNRIRAEFEEMPDMKLTIEQIQRLCGVNRSLCEAALESLVQTQFLSVTPDRRYMR
jgi:response regulator of citrate/malate metabolism